MVALVHGTTPTNAMRIAKQGFDDRLSEGVLYGAGIYFTLDFCKALKYSKDRDQEGRCCFLVARVALGHPYMAEGPMRTHRRPPMVDGLDVPHDSVIAAPGIPDRKSAKFLWFPTFSGSKIRPEEVLNSIGFRTFSRPQRHRLGDRRRNIPQQTTIDAVQCHRLLPLGSMLVILWPCH